MRFKLFKYPDSTCLHLDTEIQFGDLVGEVDTIQEGLDVARNREDITLFCVCSLMDDSLLHKGANQ